MEDELMQSIEQWLYPAPNITRGERACEVTDHFDSGGALTDGHQVCIAYAVLKSTALLVPVDHRDGSEGNTIAFRPRFDFELPQNAGVHMRSGMTLTLLPETAGEVGITIPVPVYISGDYEGELAVAYDPDAPAMETKTLSELLYAVFTGGIEDHYVDWGDVNDARWELFYRMQNFAGAVLDSEDAAFVKQLQEHLDSFQTNLQWPDRPIELESRDGRLRIAVAAGE